MKAQILTFALFIFAFYGVSGQKGLSVGDKAPEFKATADNGSTWELNMNLYAE
jgi:hypothetical protein